MKVDEIRVEGSVLHVVCSGVFGLGSACVPSGRLIENAINDAIEKDRAKALSDVAIDLSAVEYEYGDGLAWCIMPALERGFRIKYIVKDSAKKSVEELLALGVDKLGTIKVVTSN